MFALCHEHFFVELAPLG